LGIGVSGAEEEVGKGCRRVNIVQIECTHVCKWKNDTVETVPGMGRIKENGGRGEFKTFYKCHNVPPPSTPVKKIIRKEITELLNAECICSKCTTVFI
jgi:hypothetical protein